MPVRPLLPGAPPVLRRVYALLLGVAGVGAIGYAALFYALSGWGVDAGDLAYAINVAPVPLGGLLALPAFYAALRAGGARARWARGLLWASAVSVALTFGVAWADARPCADGCPSWLWWAIPFMAVAVTGGRLALALPVLAAQGRTPRLVAVALGIFIVGSIFGTIPYVAALPPLTLLTVALVGALGIAYLWMAWNTWRMPV